MNIIRFVLCNFKIFNKRIKNTRANKFFVAPVTLPMYGKMDMEIELMISSMSQHKLYMSPDIKQKIETYTSCAGV